MIEMQHTEKSGIELKQGLVKIALNTYFKKEERFQISDLNFSVKKV